MIKIPKSKERQIRREMFRQYRKNQHMIQFTQKQIDFCEREAEKWNARGRPSIGAGFSRSVRRWQRAQDFLVFGVDVVMEEITREWAVDLVAMTELLNSFFRATRDATSAA